MSKLQKISAWIKQTFQQTSSSILRAAGRIFSPSDDEYPEIGTQPFEGEIPDARHQDGS